MQTMEIGQSRSDVGESAGLSIKYGKREEKTEEKINK